MSEVEPIVFRPRKKGTANRPAQTQKYSSAAQASSQSPPQSVCFNRLELNQILTVYGRKVASGDWRDYAMDFGREKAVFSIFRRASECPLYRIEKSPKLARRQGAYAVVSAHGLILKRGHDLRRVLSSIDDAVRLVKC